MWLRGNREVAKGAEISASFTISVFKENALKIGTRIGFRRILRSQTYFESFSNLRILSGGGFGTLETYMGVECK